MNIRQIILHLGLPKTASSSIHDTLCSNKAPNCCSNKYCYSRTLSGKHGVDCYRICTGNTRNRDGLSSENCATSKHVQKLGHAYLKQELMTTNARTLLLCVEDYIAERAPNDIRLLKDFLTQVAGSDNLSFQCVVYLRNPMIRFVSRMQENIKSFPFVSSNDTDLIIKSIGEQYIQLQEFVKVFGMDNFSFYKFEDTVKHPYGPVGFFYEHVLKFSLEDIAKVNIIKSNESASQIAIDICSFVNKKSPAFDYQKVLRLDRYFEDLRCIVKNVRGPKFKLSKVDKERYLYDCLAHVEYLKKECGVEYLTEEIMNEIASDNEPCHVPDTQALKDIENVFDKIHANTQECVIDYLTDIYTIDKSPDIAYTINKLNNKRKSLKNKIRCRIHVCIRYLKNILRPVKWKVDVVYVCYIRTLWYRCMKLYYTVLRREMR